MLCVASWNDAFYVVLVTDKMSNVCAYVAGTSSRFDSIIVSI